MKSRCITKGAVSGKQIGTSIAFIIQIRKLGFQMHKVLAQ